MKQSQQGKPYLKSFRKASLWLLIATISYTVLGFLATPLLLKYFIEKKLPETLHRRTTVGEISINPYTLSITLNDFAVSKQKLQGNALAFERLHVNLQLSSLFKQALIVKSIHLQGADINFSRLSEHTYSFSDLLVATPDTEKKHHSTPFLFSLHNITLSNGKIHFEDIPQTTSHQIESINLSIPKISNMPIHIEDRVSPAFSAVINGTPFNFKGRTKPFADSRETLLSINITKLDIPAYLTYIPNNTGITLQSGKLDIGAQLSYINRPGDAKLSIAGALALHDLSFSDLQDNSYIRTPRIDLKVKSADLFSGKIEVDHLKVEQPTIDIHRQSNGEIIPISLFLANDNLAKTEKENNSGTQDSSNFTLNINKIEISKGRVQFTDKAVPQSFITTLSPVDITVENFSTTPDSQAAISISGATEAAERLNIDGTFGIAPFKISTNTVITALDLKKYSPYLTEHLAPSVNSGSMDITSHIRYSTEKTAEEFSFNNLTINLNNFTLRHEDRQLVSLPFFAISNSNLDIKQHGLKIDSIQANDAQIYLKKTKEGQLNLTHMAKSQNTAEEYNTDPTAKKASLPWLVDVKEGALKNASITFVDHGPAAVATTTMKELSLHVSKLSNRTNHKGAISVAGMLNNKGSFTGEGTLAIEPLSTNMNIAIDEMPLMPLQPYVAEHTSVTLQSGTASAKAKFNLEQHEKIEVHLSGMAKISDLATTDKAGNDLARWEQLLLSGIDFQNTPQSLHIKKVDWQGLHADLTVAEDGSLNMANLSASPKKNTRQMTETEENDHNAVLIESFQLIQASLNFSDKSITPFYGAEVTDINGEIAGLSSHKDSNAVLQINGKLNQHAPFEITGEVHPLKKDLFADVKLQFHDIDLSPASPYTGKFIGYKTDKGKLNLDLHYNIKGNSIDASNNIMLDHFTPGAAVESPDAANLPIHLAIALLQNRNGKIYLDIPVQGRLDDPDFSVGKVIFRVIFNLIAKAVTSPFALLGALIPDGEDIQYVQFAPGISDINQKAAEKLTKMAGILYERPGLRMDIVSNGIQEQDRKTLARDKLKNILIQQKITALSTSRQLTVAPDKVALTAKEYDHYLAMAYKEKLNQRVTGTKKTEVKNNQLQVLVKSKASHKGQQPKKLSKKEMEEELYKDITINNNELRLLAHKRANNIINFLAEKGPVKPNRLFIIEPKLLKEEKQKTPRFDLVIK